MGDEILVKIAESLNLQKRDYDFLARFGGEEFLLWLPNSDEGVAKVACERIKSNIEQLTLCDKSITISIGLTVYTDNTFQKSQGKAVIDSLIFEADTALYQAKKSGRNCIKVFNQSKL